MKIIIVTRKKSRRLPWRSPPDNIRVDDIDLAKGKEAGSSVNRAFCASAAGICLFPYEFFKIA
jgi:hypothetical protein